MGEPEASETNASRPVHDHGKNGRLAWVKVMSGSLKFRKYAENEFKQVEPLDDNPILLSTGETIKLIDGILRLLCTSAQH